MSFLLNESARSMLHAIVAMGFLTLVMFLWMVATRPLAMRRAGIKPQDAAHTSVLQERLPSEVQRVTDNYNHLFEAPTLFYAMVLAIVVLGHADPLHARAAWAFVALRVLHSLVQATFNRVTVRFTLFTLSWLALGLMVVREGLAAL
jgi:hypothetical protein